MAAKWSVRPRVKTCLFINFSLSNLSELFRCKDPINKPLKGRTNPLNICELSVQACYELAWCGETRELIFIGIRPLTGTKMASKWVVPRGKCPPAAICKFCFPVPRVSLHDAELYAAWYVNQCTHLVLTLCGLTSQKTNQGGLRLSGSVHEEAHPILSLIMSVL